MHAQNLRALTTSAQAQPYSAVGRIDLAGSGYCTGTLIDAQTVLTAAHCLIDEETGRPLPPADVTFYAAFQNGRSVAHSAGRTITLHPEYDPSGAKTAIAQLRVDLALISLETPLRRPGLRPFSRTARIRSGDAVGVVSYARGRTETPALQDLCSVLVEAGDMAILDCDIDKGASGAPIFATVGGQPRIVSVVAAVARQGDKKVALGPAIAPQLPILRDAASMPQTTPSVTRGTMGTGGAKFLRP